MSCLTLRSSMKAEPPIDPLHNVPLRLLQNDSVCRFSWTCENLASQPKKRRAKTKQRAKLSIVNVSLLCENEKK